MNRMRTHTFATAVVASTLVVGSLFVLRSPAQNDGQKDVQLSEVATRTLGAQTYLYAETETSFQELAGVVAPILERLEKVEAPKKVNYPGAVIFVYRGATTDMQKKFKLQIGYAVADGTQAPAGGEFKVRRLEPFKCATVLYGGPISSVGTAYEKLFGTIGRDGRKPTDESREYYFHWEGEQSVNNVEMVAVGVQ